MSFVKLLCIFLACCLLFAPCAAFCATPNWVRIVEDETRLFTNADISKTTCCLQKTYYVRVLEESGSFFLVELMDNTADFPKITGYVLQSKVEKCTAAPVAPFYPQVTLKVSASCAPIRLSPLLSAEIVVTATNTQKLSYYGSWTQNGENWHYVFYRNVFGYVLQSDTTAPAIEAHSTPLVEPNEPVDNPTTPTEPTTKDDDQTISTVLLVVFVVLLAVGLSVALFLPSKQEPVYFNDE